MRVVSVSEVDHVRLRPAPAAPCDWASATHVTITILENTRLERISRHTDPTYLINYTRVDVLL